MRNGRTNIMLLGAFCVFMVSCCPGLKKIDLGIPYKYISANDAAVFLAVSGLHEEGVIEGSGTGVAVANSRNRKQTLILTAGHICAELDSPQVLQSRIVVMTRGGEIHYSKMVGIDPNFDLCLLKIDDEIPIAKVAKHAPETGDKITYSGYPSGFYMPGILHHFDGYMAGSIPDGDHIYNIPVTGGSSGSPIYNHRGHIVGLVSAVMVEFEHITFAVGTDPIRNFILDNKNWDKE